MLLGKRKHTSRQWDGILIETLSGPSKCETKVHLNTFNWNTFKNMVWGYLCPFLLKHVYNYMSLDIQGYGCHRQCHTMSLFTTQKPSENMQLFGLIFYNTYATYVQKHHTSRYLSTQPQRALKLWRGRGREHPATTRASSLNDKPRSDPWPQSWGNWMERWMDGWWM